MPAAMWGRKNKASSEGRLQQKLPLNSCTSPSSPVWAPRGVPLARSLFTWKKEKRNFTRLLLAAVARQDGYFSGP